MILKVYQKISDIDEVRACQVQGISPDNLPSDEVVAVFIDPMDITSLTPIEMELFGDEYPGTGIRMKNGDFLAVYAVTDSILNLWIRARASKASNADEVHKAIPTIPQGIILNEFNPYKTRTK